MQSRDVTADNQGYKALTAGQVASFWENGFLNAGKVLDDA